MAAASSAGGPAPAGVAAWRPARPGRRSGPDGVGQLGCGVALEVGPALLARPRLTWREQLDEAGPGEVGAAEEGPAVGEQEHRHGPAAAARSMAWTASM